MTDIKIGNIEIRKWNYMCHKYKSDNYGSHSQALMIGNLTLFFSYDTVIAFQWEGKEYFSENDYGSKTTERHLNFLNRNGKKRIKRQEFEKLLQTALIDFKWKQVLTNGHSQS